MSDKTNDKRLDKYLETGGDDGRLSNLNISEIDGEIDVSVPYTNTVSNGLELTKYIPVAMLVIAVISLMRK